MDEGGKNTPNIAEEFAQFVRRRGFTEEDVTKRHRAEPEGLLHVTEDHWGKVNRTYFSPKPHFGNSFESSRSIIIENDGDGVYKEINIRLGFIFLDEGTQVAKFQQGGQNKVRSFMSDADIDITYDENGDILEIGFRYGRLKPKDEAESKESLEVHFNVGNKLKEKQTASGTFKITDGEGFVECVKTVNGEEVLRYRVPKKINEDEILSRLVPADLRDYPYEAPGAADTPWMNTDLLGAFGIEK